MDIDIHGQLDLDVSIKNVEQLPNAIESFIEDKVVQSLEDKLSPLHAIEDATHALINDFNTVEHDVMAALSEAGHVCA